MTDLLNATTEELLAMKAQLGNNFQASFPKVENPLKDPASGIVAPRIDVVGSAKSRLLAQATLQIKPKVRKGDFRVLETKDVAENYILIAPNPLIYFALVCVQVKDAKSEQNFIIDDTLFEQMNAESPIAVEAGDIDLWQGKISLHFFFSLYCHNDEAELAIEVNQPRMEKNRNYFNNRASAIASMQEVWSFIKKAGQDPYAENAKDGDANGHYWCAVAHEKMRQDGVAPHAFKLDADAFQQRTIEELRAQKRYLDDFTCDTVQEILGRKY
jgi:hypothetical protein